ncbi:MAG: hypothetical protein H7X88_01055, partial [Gloeobacteraceae cyanobacterium ES-bin-316]|nr:hypothetical protein [Ferruginibacter sp.]
MTKVLVWMMLAGVLFSCNRSKENDEKHLAPETVAPSFFPVTNYIYGQIEAIKDMGVNPIKIDSTVNKVDTTWLKIEDFAESFKEFVSPQIDSLNLVPFFEESKFADQTIDAYTFTYTPSKALPDSILLLKWD